MSDRVASSLPQGKPELHVVFGSGGTQALLAGTGAGLAFHVAGLTEWTSIGGASAGSMVGAILSAKMPPKQFLPYILDTDFQALLKRKTSFFGMVFALLRKYRLEQLRPKKGVFDPTAMKNFIDKLVPVWPKNYWTVASCDHGQVFFGANGVYKYAHESPYGAMLDQPAKLLTETPPSVGTAVHASCAIPGIIEAPELYGENLFDGALSSDGAVPTEMVWRHYPENPDKLVLAIDVGEDPVKNWWVMRFLWNLFCGGSCGPIDNLRPNPRPGLVVVNTRIEDFHSLKFSLSREQKWKAIVAGFQSCVRAILAHKLTDEVSAERLQQFAKAFRCMDCECHKTKSTSKDFVQKVENYLRRHDLLA